MTTGKKYNLTFILIYVAGLFVLFSLLWWWVAFVLAIFWMLPTFLATKYVAEHTFDRIDRDDD